MSSDISRTLAFMRWPLFLVVLGILADQAIKWLVESALPMQRVVEVLPFLAFFRTHNTGIAFSFFAGFGAAGLIIATMIVIIAVLFVWYRTLPGRNLSHIGFALIVSGAIGNLIDRMMHGYVIDYILFHTPVWSFAIFNLADALITIGVCFVLMDEYLILKSGRPAQTSGNGDHDR